MGCFSWLCKECGKGILSTSFDGEQVKLFLLKDGNVIEMMEGNYDSYGRVFTENGKDSIHWKADYDDMPEREKMSKEMKERCKDFSEEMKESMFKSIEASLDEDRQRERDPWGKVCDLMFSHKEDNGIAAIHTRCWKGHIPTTQSENDPNQGWGEEGELFSDCDDDCDMINERDSCLKED